MNKIAKISAISLLFVTAAATSVTASAGWGGNRGGCDRADMRGGPDKMMQKQGRFSNVNLDLNAEEAKILVQARLIKRGNDRLKVGQVSEKDADTFLVDIVTVDDSLVRQIEVDREKGLPRGRMAKK